jgi:hypothetical protein
MLHKAVRDFRRRHGSYHNYDDLMSEANLVFVLAWLSWDPEQGSFSTHLTWQLKGCFTTLSRQRPPPRQFLNGEEYTPKSEPDFCPESLLRQLSPEARLAVRLALGLPLDLFPGRRIRRRRTALVKFLKRCGWSTARIARVFSEIREELE